MTRQTERDSMVEQQIMTRGVKDPRVLRAMRHVPRHQFIPTAYAEEAYEDHPLPIGYNQTISQPYIVAFMAEMLRLEGHEKVLEIGTGSGYQTAVLAELVSKVFTIEIVEHLAKQAAKTLKGLAYNTVCARLGDGYQGWAEEAPFQAIIVTAAAGHVPQPLLAQLAVGSRMIVPIGTNSQKLLLFYRTTKGYETTELLPVSFVPMTGKSQDISSLP
ncbi:MAG: protein-L-isoaspartate(D-aspartate) O-methyltransferase [Nitrospirales bacterium]|nr:protein-L-isoaspartate(D-aspartate) O-methyltransferase [Nitrospirales bacterium]